ncbi:VvgS protein [Vibrio natriegens]|uniref:VvgS protein n=1 Tax=Vibrio natriegens TaxID=691 RepID=UPI002283C689|nr:VvgS protein [Vibrio natriegens]MCY9875377.1 VvgS protein [Vibrio natriegens]
MRKLIFVVAPIMLSACSALDSSSNFDDVVDSVNQRYDFVQVKSKAYNPATKAIKGPDVVQASMSIVANYPRTDKQPPASYISIEVATFESYDEYETVSINGQTLKLHVDQPSKSMCSEHCVVTQYLSFPISVDELSKNVDLEFELRSATSRVVTDFSIAYGYLNSVQREALLQGTLNQATTKVASPVPTAPAVLTSSLSKPEEMVRYWYKKASLQEQELFAQFAVKNRKSVQSLESSDSQSYNMLQYWYSEASKEERSEILNWIINQ